ncbi:hypothetical protein CAPTEDRAFT_79156, partial [Capitella teleta]
RKYKRKTNRGNTPIDEVKRAADAVTRGQSVRAASRDYAIDRMTLKRCTDKRAKDDRASAGYKTLSMNKLVIPGVMESDLAAHIVHLADMFHSVTVIKCCEIAYEYATANHLEVPNSWQRDKRAGRDWWLGFKQRHTLTIRNPEATSFQ